MARPNQDQARGKQRLRDEHPDARLAALGIDGLMQGLTKDRRDNDTRQTADGNGQGERHNHDEPPGATSSKGRNKGTKLRDKHGKGRKTGQRQKPMTISGGGNGRTLDDTANLAQVARAKGMPRHFRSRQKHSDLARPWNMLCSRAAAIAKGPPIPKQT